MKIIQTIEKIRVENEINAQELLSEAKNRQTKEGYILKKASYEYKTKKSKGEVIDDCYLVTLQKEFGGVWDNGEC